ncbi:MAG TPA: prepilin-type N-terminal cleavage/methylation domain-containing protein [Thermodesulfobacteriota bacterium]|nr:prepilin-type N-terminal cleavage/methylation domain-containing protein [Thermodesulfobacteriota bacterium]
MTFISKKDGFSLIELLVIVGIIGILLAMGGIFSAKYANRRSVDRVTTTISSTLQLVKLKAGRQGLEYQAVLTYDPTAETLTVVTERGNSNRGSTNYEEETSQTIEVVDGITISPTNRTFNFNPNGTLGGASGTINVTPTSGEDRERCGRVVVSPFGRISVIQGNWNSSGSGSCEAYD